LIFVPAIETPADKASSPSSSTVRLSMMDLVARFPGRERDGDAGRAAGCVAARPAGAQPAAATQRLHGRI
jgi:hypothetical protein